MWARSWTRKSTWSMRSSKDSPTYRVSRSADTSKRSVRGGRLVSSIVMTSSPEAPEARPRVACQVAGRDARRLQLVERDPGEALLGPGVGHCEHLLDDV